MRTRCHRGAATLRALSEGPLRNRGRTWGKMMMGWDFPMFSHGRHDDCHDAAWGLSDVFAPEHF